VTEPGPGAPAFPTSLEWERASGLYLSDCNDKEEQHQRIRRLGLPHLEFRRYRGDDTEIAEFIREQRPVCLIASGGRTRRVKLDVWTADEFAAFTRDLDGQDHWEYFVGNMVAALPGSYVGTALSDGHGRLYLEFLVRRYMTEIRELTAGVCDPRDLACCYVEDFTDVILTTGRVPEGDLRYLRRELAGIRGYFEFIKGMRRGEAGIYFIQYETTPAFRNLLESTDRFHFDVTARVRSTWLKWHLQ